MVKTEEIEEHLCDIFLKYGSVDFRKHKELRSKLLFGSEINLLPRELVKILFEIENKMAIRYPKEEVTNGNFTTYDNIAKTIIRMIPSIEQNKM